MLETEGTNDITEWIGADTYLVNPTSSVLRVLSRELESESNVNVKVLLYNVDFRQTDRELTTSGRFVDLINEGKVEFRELNKELQTNLLITEGAVGSIINFEDEMFVVGSTDEEVVDDMSALVKEVWESGDTLSFRTPGLTSIKDDFIKWADEEFYEVFHELVTVMEDVIYENEDVTDNKFSDRWHIYSSIVLATAIQNKVLKDVSQCAEQADLTSRSTLQAVKRTIEEAGFIGKETIDTDDLGRPPVMLKLSGLYTGANARDVGEKVYTEIKIRPEIDEEMEGGEEGEETESDESKEVGDGETSGENDSDVEQGGE